MNIDIQHDPKACKFFCMINGMECLMEYQWTEKKKMDITHTYVPPELRNQGIAEAILTRAAEYAVQEGCKIVPTCSYAASFLERNKKYKRLVVKE